MTQQSEYDSYIQNKAQDIMAALAQAASDVNRDYGYDVATAARSIMVAVRELAEVSGGNDSRACLWRVRLRLYDMETLADDPMADSDPECGPLVPGETVLMSLPAVAGWVSEMAAAYHGAPCAGLDGATLKRKLGSLRTQLSQRRDGTGCWRIPYSVITAKNAIVTRQVSCLARVDVIRETERAAG